MIGLRLPVSLPNSVWLCGLLVLCCLLPTATSWSQTAPDSTAVPLNLDDLSCAELRSVFYERVPRFVYDDQPDALYELVIYLADRCDPGEPLGRITILASIWDGSFSEAIYGYEVIGWLVDRYDADKRPPTGSSGAAFDQFTTDFADQMLPHMNAGSPEEFFCLFYGGKTEAAWSLLRSEAMADTWLSYYYEEEIDRLSKAEAPYIVTGHWGMWQPGGDQEFVGNRQLIGGTVEQRWPRWFARLVLEARAGRADEPYYVFDNGLAGLSDRWNALLLAVEGGVTVWRSGRHVTDLFVGLGYDAVVPFKDENIARAGLNLSLGAGYRFYLDAGQKWFVTADGRLEWVSERNDGGTPMGGSALSGRLGLGFRLGTDPRPRLRALGSGS